VRIAAWLYAISHTLEFLFEGGLRPITTAPLWDPITLTILAAILAVFLAPFGVLYAAMGKRGWARIVLLLFWSFMVCIYLNEGSFTEVDTNRFQWAAWLINVALQPIAVALLFTSRANRWYRGQ
jgi:hypothetical protein